jgi:hypothetical protein
MYSNRIITQHKETFKYIISDHAPVQITSQLCGHKLMSNEDDIFLSVLCLSEQISLSPICLRQFHSL